MNEQNSLQKKIIYISLKIFSFPPGTGRPAAAGSGTPYTRGKMFLVLVAVCFSVCLQDVYSSTTTDAVIGEPISISINTSCCIETISWEKKEQVIGIWPQDNGKL